MGTKFFDGWSFTHFACGFVASKTGLFNAFSFLIVHTIFEIWENTGAGNKFFQERGFPRYEGDKLVNSLGDTFFAMLGFFAGEF